MKKYSKKEVKKCEALKYFSKKELNTCNCNTDVDSLIYEFEKNGQIFVFKREGKCEPEKCGSACCKFYCFEKSTKSLNNYRRGFCDFETDFAFFTKKVCKFFKKGKCSVFKKKGFSGACLQFPHLNDAVYLKVLGVCSYRFRFLGARKGKLK